MLTFRSLVLAAVCLCSRAATLQTPARPDAEDAATPVLADRTDAVTVGFSNSSWPTTRSQTAEVDAAEALARSQTADASTAPDALSSGDSPGPRLLDAPDTWTEAAHLRAEDASVLPSSQELGTEATMSSEDLPLIFEPFEDVTRSVSTAAAAVAARDSELAALTDAGRTSSDVRLSGASAASTPVTGADPSPGRQEPEEEEEDEEMDSDEEEEESEEDLMESTMAPHTRPPYSLIPPPPVWVQRNQGLVRSWVELIREKAGHVSGMLAPVGIGIAGALLLVGALYSVRLLQRRRRDSFKHQRRKPPREVRSGPDNAMLLADSSEDEF